MADNQAVDLDGAHMEDGEPKAQTPKPIEKGGEGTPVTKEPLPVAEAIGAGQPKQDSTDVLTEALGGLKKKEPKNAEKIVETSEDGEHTFTVDELVAQTITDPDLNINQIYTSKRDLQFLSDKLHDMYPTEEEQKKASENPLSMFRLLLGAFRDGWGTNQMLSYISVLANTVKGEKERPCDNLVKEDEAGIKDGFTYAAHRKGEAVDLTGTEARNAFMSDITGVMKVKLPNSGFWVVIRRPLIHELQEIFETADLEMREVGYSIGPHFALVADVYLKRRFCESLIRYRIIRDSNLEGIFDEKNDTFYKALAFHDYDVLIWAVLSLMSRAKGFRARVVCPECDHATMLENIDIHSAKWFDKRLVTQEMRDWFNMKVDANGKAIGKRTLKDVEHYRKDICKFSYSFTEKFANTTIRINLSVPSMEKYFDIGQRIVSQIQETIDESGVEDKQRRQMILANLAAHSFHMITPWVENIEKIDDQGNVVMRTSDVTTILDLFDITTQDSSMKPVDELEKFLSLSKMTYIGLFSIECPFCHAKPDVGANQFYPLEVQTIFFGQLFRQLPPELMPQEE